MRDIITDLNIEELIKGYTKNKTDGSVQCIFCHKEFEAGVIYFSRGRNVDAERAVKEHIYDDHGGPFENLLSLDKEINGLTEIQKTLLRSMYEDEDNRVIGEKMDIKDSTVRTHKFKLQQLKREAKIFLALFAYIEDQDLMKNDNDLLSKKEDRDRVDIEQNFKSNLLHPFFGQLNLK